MVNVGVIVTDLFDNYQQTFLNGIKSYCKGKDLKLFIFVLNNNFSKKDSFQKIVKGKNIDSYVIFSIAIISKFNKETLHNLINNLPDVPKISIGYKYSKCKPLIVDNKSGVKELMGHLILKHNLKRIAFIKGPDSHFEAVERFEAYKESLVEHKLKVDFKLIAPGNFIAGDGRRALSLIMDLRKQSFDAIFCCHDQSAFEVIKTLNKRGITVPKDIVVVGFDNLDISSSMTPALTTIRQPVFNMGLIAAEFIENSTNRGLDLTPIYIKTSLIIRESCGCYHGISSIGQLDHKYSIDKKIEDIIKNASEEIISKNSFEYDVCNLNKFLQSSVELISDSILQSLKNKEKGLLISNIKKILDQSQGSSFTPSFWKYVLEEFYIYINMNDLERSLDIVLSSVINSALVILFELEKKENDFINLDNRQIIQYTNHVGDQLLTCRNETDLKQILRANLPNIKIKNFYIVLYSQEENSNELFFALDSNNIVGKDNTLFDFDQSINKEPSYIICSLMVEEHELGFILIEFGDLPYLMYNFIAEKVSYGFKNIGVIKRLDSYTKELESAVESRTLELKSANNRLQDRYFKDQLTGLYNRRFLDEVVVKEGLSCIDRESCGVIMVDLDHFKLVNDKYGHVSGDMVIVELAKIFSYSLRPEDYVIRLGGEEFLLILRNFKSEYIKNVVEKIRISVEKSIFKMENGEEIHKTCSLGAMVFYPSTFSLLNIKSSISIIDKCLYLSKNKGRNRGYIINIFEDQFNGCSDVESYITNNFEKCLSTKKIELIESFLSEN